MVAAERRLVLLAEDDPAQSEVLTEVLEYEGYRTLVAANPEQVVEALQRRPDAVLLDLSGISSPAVLSALGTPAPHRPSVIVVSANRDLPRLAQEMGADAYLAKPYNLEDLLSLLLTQLSAQPHAAPLT